jgi:DNA gyrase/topoisomerase IV subunit A
VRATDEHRAIPAIVDLTSHGLAADPDRGLLRGATSDRIHVIDGLLRALDHAEAINRTVRLSRDRFSARVALQQPPFGFSEAQAEAILAMPIAQQSFEAVEQLRSERRSLEDELARQTAPESAPAVHWFG